MIIRDSNAVIISQNSNNIYWEQGVYPDWAAISAFRTFPNQMSGTGVEPHYHDNDEFWLFTSGHGEVWLDGQSFEITPNTVVYTPMGVVHRFQMFTDYENNAIVTPLERRKRPTHILVQEAGPPIPTVPGFVVAGAANNGSFPDRGPRCPLSQMRSISLAAGEGVEGISLLHNEYWLVLDGFIHLAIDGREIELGPGDVALLKAGSVPRLQAVGKARAVLARQ